MTGVIVARKVRGPSAVRVGVLTERIPSLILNLKELVAAEDEDRLETLEIATERVAVVVGISAETQEAVAVLADKSQPTALIHAALTRSIRAYLAQVQQPRMQG
jgi:hypothetical protein